MDQHYVLVPEGGLVAYAAGEQMLPGNEYFCAAPQGPSMAPVADNQPFSVISQWQVDAPLRVSSLGIADLEQL